MLCDSWDPKMTFTGLKVAKVSIWIMDLETTGRKRELYSLHLQDTSLQSTQQSFSRN